MTLTEKISPMREKINALTARKRATTARTVADRVLLDLRLGSQFLRFVHSLERSHRIGSRFALHVERVERAAETPVTSYLRFLAEVA